MASGGVRAVVQALARNAATAAARVAGSVAAVTDRAAAIVERNAGDLLEADDRADDLGVQLGPAAFQDEETRSSNR